MTYLLYLYIYFYNMYRDFWVIGFTIYGDRIYNRDDSSWWVRVNVFPTLGELFVRRFSLKIFSDFVLIFIFTISNFFLDLFFSFGVYNCFDCITFVLESSLVMILGDRKYNFSDSVKTSLFTFKWFFISLKFTLSDILYT